MASSGYINNNPGNLGYPNGASPEDWEGWTGTTYVTADGNINYVFSDMVYGLRALMVVIDNKIKSGLSDIESIYLDYRGLDATPSNIQSVQANCDIIRSFFSNGNTFQNEDAVIDQSDTSILAISKGIVKTEIPEYNDITTAQWQSALNYYDSGDYSSSPSLSSASSSSTGIYVIGVGLLIILGSFFLGSFFVRKK